MTIHRKIATSAVTAIAGASLVIAVSTPAGASPPTRFEVCPAILTEPICNLLREPDSDSGGGGGGGGTLPEVLPQLTDRRSGPPDTSCGGRPTASVVVCIG